MVDKSAILELMDEAEAVYFATVDGGAPRIRALVNLRLRDQYPGASEFCRAQGFAAYFATSGSSGKVREVRANPAVAVYYCTPERYHGVTLAGRAEILTNPELKRSLWHDGWTVYWPDGAEDPDYVVVRVDPVELTGWWEGQPFHFAAGQLR